MGFISNLFGGTRQDSPAGQSLQQEGNQQMLKMLQDRLAQSTCPTERQQLQNNINAIQRQQTPQPPVPPLPSAPPVMQPQPKSPPAPEISLMLMEISNIKNSIARLEAQLTK